MSNENIFYSIEVLILIVPTIFLFRKFSFFFSCLWSFLFIGFYALFSNRLWNSNYDRSMRFTGYIFIILVLTVINTYISNRFYPFLNSN